MKSNPHLVPLGLCSALFALMSTNATAGGTVAITEFLNNTAESDDGREFVELYNYGALDVDLSGWTLSDEDSDAHSFDSLSIGAEDFLILVLGSSSLGGEDKKALFESEWLGGTSDARVIGVDSKWLMSNGADEVQLHDEADSLVWSLAYSDDESEGRATFLVDDSYATSTFGSKASPGVVREGDDNGTPDFLGYESNDSALATDPNTYESTVGNVASPLFLSQEQEAPPFTLSLSGDCPGTVTLEVSGATPHENVGIVYAEGPGCVSIPAGNPCNGTILNLNRTLALYDYLAADAEGKIEFSLDIPGRACGYMVQVFDVATCTTSSVESL